MYALLEFGRDPEAAELLKCYNKDGSAAWAWSGALLAYRRVGAAPAASKALAKAIEANPHVMAYLLGRKPLPRTLPNFIGIGDKDEAVAYVHDAACAWPAAHGATTWAAEALTIPIQPAARNRSSLPNQA